MPHVARLAELTAFDESTVKTQPVADGITIRMGCRHGSKTREGIAYEFSAETFTADAALEWMTQRSIGMAAFEPEADGITLEEDGTYTLRGVECAEEGTWYAAKGGKVEFTAELLDTATTETNEAVDLLRPAFTLGHGEQSAEIAPEDGQPRFGFATKFYRRGKKVLCDMRKVPAVAVKALSAGLWGRLSPTLMLNWPDPRTGKRRPIVFQALALLGATPPAISTIQDLTDWIDGQTVKLANEPTLSLSLGLSDVVSVVEFGAPVAAAAVVGNDEGSNTGSETGNEEKTEMSKEEIIALVEELIAKALGAGGGGESEEMKQKTAELAAARSELYVERLSRAAEDGKILPAEIKAQATALIEMSSESARAVLTAIEARPAAKQPTGTVGNPNAPADPLADLTGEKKIMAFAFKHAAEGKGTFAEGSIIACQMFPADAKQMRIEQGMFVPAGD